ncbi:MAG: caspase family protein [Thermodesulfovibrionales bacterium]|jgi:hypothetical protein|nr:caspase family protein [Thermodesulfovibrionales bacterium]
MRRISGYIVVLLFIVWVVPAFSFSAAPPKPKPLQEASPDNAEERPVLYDPFDRENPLVKLPGMALTYTKGHDRSDAIYFDGSTYLKEPSLGFVPSGKNWIEGTVEFWIKPEKYPVAPGNWQIVLFNWNDYPKPQAGYVGDISITPEGRIMNNCGWEWGGGNPPVITSRSFVPLNVWTHVAVAWSKTEGYTRIYINNKLDAEIEMYCARGSNGSIYPWLAGYGGFVGAVDDFKIYKTPREAPFYGDIKTVKKEAPKPYTPRPDETKTDVTDVRIIPSFNASYGENDIAVVIGIENYKGLPKSDFSGSDAGLMLDYLKALGFQRRNIEFVSDADATKSGLEKVIEAWLPNRVKKDSRIFFYYSGHGAPEPKTGDAYLVPYDGDPNYLEVTGYSLKRLYDNLGKLQAAEVIVLLDSCFSGAGGRSVLAKGTRPLVMITDIKTIPSNMAILSATQGSQISISSTEKGHGVFTYYFLKAIKDGKKTIADIYEYIKPMVEDKAKMLNVQQSPSISPDVERLKGRFILRR